MKSDPVRLNKYIADTGLCSRREADARIAAGRVKVNNKIVKELGAKISPEKDRVMVDGQLLHVASRKTYLAFYKPAGLITTKKDEKNRKTIYDVLPKRYGRLDPAGRLDKDTSGLLLLSDDGDFIYKITHPRFHVQKIYHVTLDRIISQKDVQKMLEGILLEPENKVATIEWIENTATPGVYKICLVTGYNRQIRRTFEGLGYRIKALKRVAFGAITLKGLKTGELRPLTQLERRQLMGREKQQPAKKVRPKK